MLVRTYLTYVWPLVEHDSVVCFLYTAKDIDGIEAVQRRFTKRLPVHKNLSYSELLKRINLPSLELCRAIAPYWNDEKT